MKLRASVAGQLALLPKSPFQFALHKGATHRSSTPFKGYFCPRKKHVPSAQAGSSAGLGQEPPTPIQQLSNFLQVNYIPIALLSAIVLG